MAVPGAYFLRKKGGDSPLVIILFTECGCIKAELREGRRAAGFRRRKAPAFAIRGQLGLRGPPTKISASKTVRVEALRLHGGFDDVIGKA